MQHSTSCEFASHRPIWWLTRDFRRCRRLLVLLNHMERNSLTVAVLGVRLTMTTVTTTAIPLLLTLIGFSQHAVVKLLTS